MTSQCKNMAQPRQSDFSINHILTKAGERYAKRRRLEESLSCCSNTSQSHSSEDSDENLASAEEEDEEIVVDSDSVLGLQQQRQQHHLTQLHQLQQRSEDSRSSGSAASYLQNCMPSFDWLYYTRYRPPKLPRPQKPGPVKRTPGRLPRVPFTPAQLSALEDAYKVSTYLSSEEANQLAYGLELTNTRVKIWFQNRRARDRREKREAVGGGAPTAAQPIGHFAFFGAPPPPVPSEIVRPDSPAGSSSEGGRGSEPSSSPKREPFAALK